MTKIFQCKDLDKLDEKGKLKHLFKKLHRQINEETWLGSGSEAAAFYYDHEVIKVCPKRIRYFSEAGHSSADLFREQVNKLQPFLVPVKKILYEDKHVVAYTQEKCQLLKDEDYKSPYIVISFLQLIIFMFENNQLVSDIGIHNLGLLDGQLVVFDYHGLHPITRNGHVRRHKWWKRPITNLSNFLEYIKHKGNGFSDNYKKFLSGLPECRNDRDLQRLTRLLYKCLDILLDDAHLHDKEWKKIFARNKLLSLTL